MTLRHLKIFVAVCDCGNITKASKKLFVSQPSISTAIKNLEQYYDVKLFDRISRKLYLTELGKQFLEQSRHLVALYESMESGINDWNTCGVLKVGSSITVGNCLLPYYINSFKSKHDNIKINVSINSSKIIESKIMENEIDIAIIEGVPKSNKIVSEVLMEDELAVICHREHPFSKFKQITLEQLASSDLILREKGSGTRELFDTMLLVHNIIAEPIWESVSTQAIVNAVRLGLGISVLPHRLVKKDLEQNIIHLLTVKEIEFKRKFYIIHHIDKYISRPAKEFMETCRTFDLKELI